MHRSGTVAAMTVAYPQDEQTAAGSRALAEAEAAGDPAAAAAARRRLTARAADADDDDRRSYADALAALGFAARAESLRESVATRPPPEPKAIDPAGIRIHLSARQRRVDESDRAHLAALIGARDYSYGFALRGFMDALERLGIPFAIVRHPEGIADIRDRSDAACNIHLGFYPPEQLRLLKGAYNVACLAWEFDRLRLPSEVIDPHAFADQATMLALPDELWVPSTHGTAAIRHSVATLTHRVPAPVPAMLRRGAAKGPPTPARVATLAAGLDGIMWQPLAILPRLQDAMDDTASLHRRDLGRILAAFDPASPPAIFVTVLNVHDYRKQIRPMLQGFGAFSQTRPDAILLVKSSTPARGAQPLNSVLLAEQIFDVGERSRPIVSDRIWITDDVFTRAEMDRLYDIASFYLCTSHAEGQNLPLLEAMGRGVVPVSVDHTAMADYIRVDNAVPIRSVRRPFDRRLSRRYGMYGLETNFVGAADVHAALAAAMALSPADHAARALAAHATVRDDYGDAALAAALRAVIDRARTAGAARG